MDTCFIGEIKFLYEQLNAIKGRDPCRAIVQWYSRCKELPEKIIRDENFAFSHNEVIQDFRPFDRDISIETIFNKCKILFDSKEIKKLYTNKMNKKNDAVPTYACRYKLILKKGTKQYILVPQNNVEPIQTALATPKRSPSLKDNYTIVKSNKKTNKTPNSNIVSPIKLINNNSIKKFDNYHDSNGETPKKRSKTISLPLSDKKIIPRRSLYVNEEENNDKKNIENYAIVKTSGDSEDAIKIKIKITERSENL